MSASDPDERSRRWWTMSIAEQLGNIGSEVSRAAKWQSRNPELARAALYRALDLFDLTLDDPRHRQSLARLREIARAREVVVDVFDGPQQYLGSVASLQRYFDAFAAYRSQAMATHRSGSSTIPS